MSTFCSPLLHAKSTARSGNADMMAWQEPELLFQTAVFTEIDQIIIFYPLKPDSFSAGFFRMK